MSTGVIVAIAVAAVLVVIVLGFVISHTRARAERRELERRRGRAVESHRREAEVRAERADVAERRRADLPSGRRVAIGPRPSFTWNGPRSTSVGWPTASCPARNQSGSPRSRYILTSGPEAGRGEPSLEFLRESRPDTDKSFMVVCCGSGWTDTRRIDRGCRREG